MAKFAFIINVEGADPATHKAELQGKNLNRIYCVDGKDAAEGLVKDLDKEVFRIFNFCGDFTAKDMEKYEADVTGGAKFQNARYAPEQKEKLEKLDSFAEYGVIIIDSGMVGIRKAEISAPGCNVRVRFIRNVKEAGNAAMELVDEGIDFIELCSWFDGEKTGAIIKAVDGKVPVGSCGI